MQRRTIIMTGRIILSLVLMTTIVQVFFKPALISSNDTYSEGGRNRNDMDKFQSLDGSMHSKLRYNRRKMVEKDHMNTYYEWHHSSHSFVQKQINIPAEKKFNSSTMPFYASQYGQDWFIVQLLQYQPPHFRGHFFVDLAANHWRDLSNTYALETFHGFRGICIVPNDEYLLGLISNRTCDVVKSAVSSHENQIVSFRPNGEYGGILGSELDNKPVNSSLTNSSNAALSSSDVGMNATTLTNILDFLQAPLVIDYLSLDVEGAEFLVLAGLNLTRYTFLIISVERPTQRVHGILSQNGYWWLKNMHSDCFYVHESYDNFTLTMQSHREHASTIWYNTAHLYLLHPKWPPAKTNNFIISPPTHSSPRANTNKGLISRNANPKHPVMSNSVHKSRQSPAMQQNQHKIQQTLHQQRADAQFGTSQAEASTAYDIDVTNKKQLAKGLLDFNTKLEAKRATAKNVHPLYPKYGLASGAALAERLKLLTVVDGGG